MSILNEYDQPGRWIFIKVDSFYTLPNNYEVVSPMAIYKALEENFTSYSKKSFLYDAFEALTRVKEYNKFPNKKYQIEGVKVNMKCFKNLNKLSTKRIIKKYFDKQGALRSEYDNILYELIAVCYTRQVKVITLEGKRPYYEVFR